jgi:5-methylcytosine-specific restriction endonuclease McrA
MTVTAKRCPDCGETKPAGQWGQNKRTKSGLAAYCKSCTSVRNRAQYAANQERRIAEAAAYRQENAETISARAKAKRQTEQYREQRRDYLARNADRISERERAWRDRHPGYSKAWRASVNTHRLAWEADHREANRERYRERSRQQREQNPLRFRRAKHKYRASKITNGHVPYTSEQWAAKFDYWGRSCWICRADLSAASYDIDHVKPLNKGGMDCLANLRPACAGCNRGKRDRWPYTPKRSPEDAHGRRS